MPDVYGVFEGGGVRGTALVGAVAAAEARQVTFRAVAGTSAGAIVAACVAAGYNASELRTLLTQTNFQTFKDPVSRIPGWQWLSAWWALGLYKGEAFQRWIGETLSLKLTGLRNASPCFQDLPKPLTVIATDVVRQQVKVFSSRRTPDMAVADAVRMSMSIPFFFCPVRFGSELIVDGGVLSNFPAWAFDEEQRTAPLPIVGLRLQPDDVPPAQISNQLALAKALATTMMRASVSLQTAHVAGLYVIDLPTLAIQATDFDISETRKDQLYQAGYNAALAYLATTTLVPPTPPGVMPTPMPAAPEG